ncbi:MAG: hypothetical protein M3Q45_10705 [Chloroflexota bacterium]|nr:hypothetical protein [Chloroflexota bacterium]
MNTIKLSVWVGEDKRLIVDLPPEVPVGMVDVQILLPETIRKEAAPTTNGGHVETAAEKRERFRKILRDAGMLSTAHRAPEGYVPMTDEERMQLSKLPPGARPTDEYVDEDRGPR